MHKQVSEFSGQHPKIQNGQSYFFKRKHSSEKHQVLVLGQEGGISHQFSHVSCIPLVCLVRGAFDMHVTHKKSPPSLPFLFLSLHTTPGGSEDREEITSLPVPNL
jgi:hypothetical protein